MNINNRDEGIGGVLGIVLSLDNDGSCKPDFSLIYIYFFYYLFFLPLTSLSTNRIYRIYTLPIKVGTTNKPFSLQVDTGSSDLVSNVSR